MKPLDLLEHRGFVRGVVRGLLADEHAVDDVVQETCLRALESPPRAPRGWLARVAKNLALTARRREKSRDRREREAARPERQMSASEAASRLERHRLVVEAVLALEEPFRAAVLLRFYDDLPPRAIARELNVPVETVRSRLRRGLERLRARLDERHGGDRAAWSLALLPLAGGALLSAKTKLSVVAVLLCIAAVGTVTWRSVAPQERAARSASARPAPEVEGVRGTEAGAPEPPTLPEAAPTDRTGDAEAGVESGIPSPYRLAESTGESSGALRVIAQDDAGNALAAVSVVAKDGRRSQRVATGPDGVAEFRPVGAGTWVVTAICSPATGQGRFRSATVEVVRERYTEVVVVFRRGATFEGEVRHVDRGPLADVSVALDIAHGPDGFSEWFRGGTDARGRYRLEGLPPGDHPLIVWGGVLGQDQHPRAILAVREPGLRTHDIVVGRVALRGTARAADTGAPIQGVRVRVLWPPHQPAEAATGPSGLYQIDDLPAAEPYVVEVDRDGYIPHTCKSPPIPADGAATMDLSLKKAAALVIEVLDRDSRPVPGKHGVKLWDAEGRDVEFWLDADASGIGRYERLPPGDYEIALGAKGYLPWRGRVELGPERGRLEVRLEPKGRVGLQGTVRDAVTRKPVAGAQVRLVRPWRVETATDTDGTYRIFDLEPGAGVVRAARDGYGPRVVDTVEIGAEPTTLDIDLDPAATLHVHATDRTGAPVAGKLSLIVVSRDKKIDMLTELAANPDGQAAYRQILPGSYDLVVSQPGVGEAKVAVEIAPGENAVRVRLE